MRTLCLIAVAALDFAAFPASACSPGPDYRVPSNLEQVRQAETIVLAQVVAGQLDLANEDPFESTITLRPLAALKGALPAGEIALKGLMLSRDAGPELGMLSDPHEFERAHPGSYAGACIRFVFPLGTTALFFLRRGDDGLWAPAGDPFTRWAEDVTGSDAPWVELVRRYVQAAALPAAERTAWLAQQREALRADDGDVAQLMAQDIARQLAAPGS
ncbi:MAG TPA: hypothetical protein VI168_16335 [Croceibacterium sp.]